MTIEQTLAERGNRYGDFTDHAKIAQDLQDVMRDADGFHQCSAVQKQALTVIADKIARILSGDPNYADNWHDIQGYAKLAEDRIPAVPVAANDNAKPIYPELPKGFLPWDPSETMTPPTRVSHVFIRRGEAVATQDMRALTWGEFRMNPEVEIIGYRQHD